MRIVKPFAVVWIAFCLAVAAWADIAPSSASTPASDDKQGVVRVFNRDVVTFRGSLLGVSAYDRGKRAQLRISEMLNVPGAHQVTLKPELGFTMVQIDGATAFSLTPEDADKLNQEPLDVKTQQAVKALERVIAETRESRSLDAITRAVGHSVWATLVALLMGWLLMRGRNAIEGWIQPFLNRRLESLPVQGATVMHELRLARVVQIAMTLVHRLILFLVIYEWISFILARFPFTRPWGELLSGFLWDLAAQIGRSIANALPGLFTAAVIFYLALMVMRTLDSFFENVRTGKLHFAWIDSEVAEPTRRIAKLLVGLFALAMSYPYLPGSQTDAFKGLSVLLGLMVSLGASNLVGQGASGLILTYGRVFRRGEFVRVGAHEGTIMELGVFTTRIRTGLGEELTISNSTILADTTKNYSRGAKGEGYVLDTQVTIGYDTPWRQVHAMLIAAAGRTPGILTDPEPKVYQTALTDWYPQYRLVCEAAPTEPQPRAMLLSALHANIQDVFNEYGVQIMSPQYVRDPASPKIVPPDRWFEAPAIPPGQS